MDGLTHEGLNSGLPTCKPGGKRVSDSALAKKNIEKDFPWIMEVGVVEDQGHEMMPLTDIDRLPIRPTLEYLPYTQGPFAPKGSMTTGHSCTTFVAWHHLLEIGYMMTYHSGGWKHHT